MSGLRKAKKYDWKDSNLAFFGSDTERNVKKESAETEKAWKGAGQKPGIQIWRIVKFKVTHWPQEDYGEFFNGDSYIILNTYKAKESDELLYDVHFWIGANSTQDEYGTAAYKTVELDTLLDDKPVQHREVEGNESNLFKSYFKTITLLEGGADSGFRQVTPEKYETRMFHVSGIKKGVQVKQVEMKKGNMKDGDVFIIDFGLKIYQWNGKDANKDEKFKAVQYLQKLKSERGGKPEVETLDDQEVANLPSVLADVLSEGATERDDEHDGPKVKILFKLSDASGNLKFEEIATGEDVKKDLLSSDDVFILDTGDHCYVWSGSGASVDERRNALTYAHNYLSKTKHPLLPITCYTEMNASSEFLKEFN